jgi:predicted nucleotide-binding protein
MDWAEHFRTGRTIMEEIERAANVCRCGIFLFTPDDPIEGSPTATNVPRDNVLLEAGYFTKARGKERVAIVREAGTKMPVDLGGVIYLTLKKRADWLPVAHQLERFLAENLKG